MVAKVETEKNKLDILLWALVLTLVVAIGVGNFYFANLSLLYRLVSSLLISAFAVFFVSKTFSGKRAWQLWKEAIIEIKKVVWPTRKETVQSSVAVIAMVFLMGLLLWAVDSILMKAVAWFTS